MDKFTAVIESFNSPFSVIDTPRSQNIRKTEGGLNHTTNQLGLADVCRNPPPHLPTSHQHQQNTHCFPVYMEHSPR